MSWIDRINAAIVRRIHGKVPLIADEQGLEQAGQRVAYAELQRAVAYRHRNLVGYSLQGRYEVEAVSTEDQNHATEIGPAFRDNGYDLALVLDFGEGRVVTIAENHEAWTTVLAALDRDPCNKRPSAEWRLELVAGAEDVRLDLLD